MNISSWLEDIEVSDAIETNPGQLLETRKRKRKPQQQQQTYTPAVSATDMNISSEARSPSKRRRRDDPMDDIPDIDRTPRGRGSKAWSTSNRTGSDRSSTTSTSRMSPTKHLSRLEVTGNPVVVAQITNTTNKRMPLELRIILDELDGFQNRIGIVPKYLAEDIRARAENDHKFSRFSPSTFEDNTTNSMDTESDPKLSLYDILKIFGSAIECFEEDHAEATWNTLVHWPVFELALGPIVDVVETDGQSYSREDRVRVRGMPCTAARLINRAHGSKMVDYCIFVEPKAQEAERIAGIRAEDYNINHTDYNPLRERPIVLSAESKKPSEGGRNMQLQLGVWHAAQWAALEELLGTRAETERPPAIPFLPALIIQDHDWSFAASTRSGNKTILWSQQPIGTTASLLGIFQLVRSLRHIGAWIRESYWPWYRCAVLQLSGEDVST
ncbi:hypothetical protein F4810DRAFT_702689 [Camillea tinctor]|nr:hypothetical protein F4810DRAFT_702689 [Camillea tinctor]